MEQTQIFRQMLQLNKLFFDNMFNSVVMFQEQMENMATMVPTPWIPALTLLALPSIDKFLHLC